MNLNSDCRFKKTGPGHRVTERPTNFFSLNSSQLFVHSSNCKAVFKYFKNNLSFSIFLAKNSEAS